PREGLAAAVDVGTTTVVAQLLDLKTGRVLAVCSGMNEQAIHGADIMSRVTHAAIGGLDELAGIIRRQVGEMLNTLLEESGANPTDLKQAALVGNTVMHHIFSRLDVSPLAHHPFAPDHLEMQSFTADELGWADGVDNLRVMFLPCLGGFVGSDILAGVIATRLHERSSPAALVDLGTNGEMVVGNRERLLCASTAAGPAFEGARIAMGMRAATGAIVEVTLQDGHPRCRVLGRTAPRGICGSGLVDAVAVGLEMGAVLPNGRLTNGSDFMLSPPVYLTQCDVRELQLAKGAIATGLRILVERWGTHLDQLSRVYLAGAFGNYMNLSSAARIGLLPLRSDQLEAAGNTALRGAKLALFQIANLRKTCASIRSMTEHISLNED
ncbi:MAG TPA: ASKHA domain-containing protein, partial [Verrucomicrobiae bacterium]|nr:ASKHA domain-containing protein [Verrucomicrobiae bacterium]